MFFLPSLSDESDIGILATGMMALNRALALPAGEESVASMGTHKPDTLSELSAKLAESRMWQTGTCYVSVVLEKTLHNL